MNPLNQALEMIVPLVGTFGSFVLIGWIVWVIARTRRERTVRMVELQSRMLEKFTSSDEFAAFIRTNEGQRYLSGFFAEPRKNPKQRIITTIRTGVVLLVFGAGLIALGFLVGFENPMEEPPFVIGFLAVFLGTGFLASAAVSYTMSKSWGLFPDEQRPVSTTNGK